VGYDGLLNPFPGLDFSRLTHPTLMHIFSCVTALDMGLGQFFTILEYVCSQTDTYFAKVNKDYTSQVCPECGTHTGKKELLQRVHSCPECGYTVDRDVAASMIVKQRGLTAVGAPVVKQPSNGVLSGTSV